MSKKNVAREDERYVPSIESELLARIFDGEARAEVPPTLDDADLERGKRLLSILRDALSSDDRRILVNLPEVLDILEERPRTARARLLRYVDTVALWGDHMQSEERLAQRVARERPLLLEETMRGLRRRYELARDQLSLLDQEFVSLEPRDLRTALLRIRVGGGQGRVGADRVSAELACEHGAFGTANDPHRGTEKQLVAFTSRIRVERKTENDRASGAPKKPQKRRKKQTKRQTR